MRVVAFSMVIRCYNSRSFYLTDLYISFTCILLCD